MSFLTLIEICVVQDLTLSILCHCLAKSPRKVTASQHLSISVFALFSGGGADMKPEPWSPDKLLEARLSVRAKIITIHNMFYIVARHCASIVVFNPLKML